MRDAKGRFLPGPDKDRHEFTCEECSDGFWAMVSSIARRYPEAYHPLTGNHMVLRALPVLIERKRR